MNEAFETIIIRDLAVGNPVRLRMGEPRPAYGEPVTEGDRPWGAPDLASPAGAR